MKHHRCNVKDVMQDLWCCVGFLYGEGETMLGHDLIVAPTQSQPPALIESSGRKARDRIEHFLRAAIEPVGTLGHSTTGPDRFSSS